MLYTVLICSEYKCNAGEACPQSSREAHRQRRGVSNSMLERCTFTANRITALYQEGESARQSQGNLGGPADEVPTTGRPDSRFAHARLYDNVLSAMNHLKCRGTKQLTSNTVASLETDVGPTNRAILSESLPQAPIQRPADIRRESETHRIDDWLKVHPHNEPCSVLYEETVLLKHA